MSKFQINDLLPSTHTHTSISTAHALPGKLCCLFQLININKEWNQMRLTVCFDVKLIWVCRCSEIQIRTVRAWCRNSTRSCMCYFDTGWQRGERRGHERQWFTSESRSDLTWIKWRNCQRWLPQAPAPVWKCERRLRWRGQGGTERGSSIPVLNAGWAI